MLPRVFPQSPIGMNLPAPLCGHVFSGVEPCPTAGQAIGLLSSWGKAKRNPRPGSQGTLACSNGVCESESDPTQPLSCHSLGKDGFGPCRALAPKATLGCVHGWPMVVITSDSLTTRAGTELGSPGLGPLFLSQPRHRQDHCPAGLTSSERAAQLCDPR